MSLPNAEPSIDFPWQEIYEHEEPPEENETAGEGVTLGKLFGLMLTFGGTNPLQLFITANVLAYVLGIHPNQGVSGETIAAGLRMKKAAWFRRVNQMRKLLKERNAILPRIAGEWSMAARENIKQKTKESHEQKKQRARNCADGREIIDRLKRAHSRPRSQD